MCDQSIKECFDYVLPLVKQAGEVIKNAKNFKIETKDEDYDLVTEYDRKVEEVLVAKIKERFPMHRFIGEEESSITGHIDELTNAPTWIIDPIDGTANFVRQNPLSCISVGLTINKVPVLGIIYNPFMEELYTAIKGEGAYRNGERIFTSGCKDISKCLFTYELSLARWDALREMYLSRLKYLISIVQGFRSLGSAAVSLCFVACGYTDAYQCDGLYPWDVAAGYVIVTEAGGSFHDTNSGENIDIMKPNFIASASEALGKQLIELEKEADIERKALGYESNEL